MRTVLSLLLLSAAFFEGSLATDYYVSAFGSDSNSGTSSNDAFLTIDHAVSTSKDGDTVNIEQGSYAEQITIQDKSITINGESTVASATQISEPFEIRQSTAATSNAVPMNVTVNNIAFVNSAGGSGGYGVYVDAANVVLNNIVTANVQTGIVLPYRPWLSQYTRSLTVTNSELQGDATKATNTIGIQIKVTGRQTYSQTGDTRVTVQNTLIHDHNSAAIAVGVNKLSPGYYGGAIYLQTDSCQIFNSAIGINYLGYTFDWKSTATTFKNNEIAGLYIDRRGPPATISTNLATTKFIGGQYGIFTDSASYYTLKMIGSGVTVDKATVSGIQLAVKGTIALKQSAIQNCGSPNTVKGGGLNVSESTMSVTLQGVNFNNNQAQYGAAIALSASSTLNARLGAFDSNTAVNGGGGIWCDAAQAHIGDTSFTNNHAPGGASGQCTTACVMYASKNTFTKNGPGGPDCQGFAG